MTIELDKDVLDTIQKHLPKMAGDALLKRLGEVNALQASLTEAHARVELLERRAKDVEESLAKHAFLEAREKALSAREAELQKTELDFLRKEAGLRAAVAEEKAAVALDLVKTLVRNPVVRRSVTANVPVAVEGSPASQYGSGYGGSVQQHTASQVTTEEEE